MAFDRVFTDSYNAATRNCSLVCNELPMLMMSGAPIDGKLLHTFEVLKEGIPLVKGLRAMEAKEKVV